ncbi:SH3 domain-containing protein [Thermodesulfobacteriota bacterium]
MSFNDFKKYYENMQRMLESPVVKAFEELTRQQNSLIKSISSPLFEATRRINEQEKIWRKILDPPHVRTLKYLQEQSSLLHMNTDVLSATANALSKADWKEIFQPACSGYLESLTKQNDYLRKIVNSPSYRSIVDIIPNHSYYDGLLIKDFYDSFAGQVFKCFENLPENWEFEDIENDIDSVFKEHCRKLPSGIISYEGMLQLFLTILFFCLSTIQTNESEERILTFLKQTEERVFQRIEELHPKQITGTLYVVKRDVRLRVKPTTKNSQIITVLHSNQIVTLLKRNKKWIYVEYFDFIEGIPRTGWVYKKYLKKVVSEITPRW